MEAADVKLWYYGLRTAFITVAEHELMVSRSLTTRWLDQTWLSRVLRGYAVNWTVQRLREPDQPADDRIDLRTNVGPHSSRRSDSMETVLAGH